MIETLEAETTTETERRRAAIARRIEDLGYIYPWLSDKCGGSGVLGDVVYQTSCRFRQAAVRDCADLVIPGGVTLYGCHALVMRATGEVFTGLAPGGWVNLDGAAEGGPTGPGAPAATIVEKGGALLVTCRTCSRVHLAAGGTSLAAWHLFVTAFGGEVFLCPCGVESELRFDT